MSPRDSVWDRIRKRDAVRRKRITKAEALRRKDVALTNAVTVTVCNRATGALRTFATSDDAGKHAALRAVLAPYPPSEWRVVSVSTSVSILADLKRGGRKSRLRPETTLLVPAGLGAYLAD